MRSVSTVTGVWLHCQRCVGPEAPSPAPSLAADLFPYLFYQDLSLWLCLRSELWVSLTVDTGAVSAAFTLGWGVGWRPCPRPG